MLLVLSEKMQFWLQPAAKNPGGTDWFPPVQHEIQECSGDPHLNPKVGMDLDSQLRSQRSHVLYVSCKDDLMNCYRIDQTQQLNQRNLPESANGPPNLSQDEFVP